MVGEPIRGARSAAALGSRRGRARARDLTWEAFGEGGRELARQVADDGYRPDIILAIARGGLFAAGLLGYALSVKNMYVINVEYYTGVEERLPMPVALPPTPELVDIEDASLLIADDVADTGTRWPSSTISAAAASATCAPPSSTRSPTP
jgi:hypoxanthine phosphoribosyltransferase